MLHKSCMQDARITNKMTEVEQQISRCFDQRKDLEIEKNEIDREGKGPYSIGLRVGVDSMIDALNWALMHHGIVNGRMTCAMLVLRAT